jgi:O-methyltransferase involved in polyketide biosynthesis
MDNAAQDSTQKPATAARMYDYFLGGVHNFPADQEAAKKVIAQFPLIPAIARANRAFMGRAVRHLAASGVRQFLDVGSGIPTEGNVHEIAQEIAPDSRVVYVDIDPVAVAEGLDILDGNPRATAVRADLRAPQAILDHLEVRRLLDFDQPIALLLAAVLHFVPEDEQAYDVVAQLVAAVAPGSYLVVSHAATESFPASSERSQAAAVYKRQTATPGASRTRSETERFFTGLELMDPGVVWLHEWRPDGDEPAEFAGQPQRSGVWAGLGRKK